MIPAMVNMSTRKIWNMFVSIFIFSYVTFCFVEGQDDNEKALLQDIKQKVDQLVKTQYSFEIQLEAVETKLNSELFYSKMTKETIDSLETKVNELDSNWEATKHALETIAWQTSRIFAQVNSSNRVTGLTGKDFKNRLDDLDNGQSKIERRLTDLQIKSEKNLVQLDSILNGTGGGSSTGRCVNVSPRNSNNDIRNTDYEDDSESWDESNGCRCFYPQDCTDIFLSSGKTNGIYDIYPIIHGRNRQLKVFCDMTTSSGGWTVIQRRDANFKPRIHFNRTWSEYKEGFGVLDKEFFLGLDNLSWMTSNRNYKLRVDLTDFENHHRYAEYKVFSVGNEYSQYLLNLREFKGDAGNGMEWQNNMKFSTKDVDNDRHATRHCAREWNSAWWFNNCDHSNLNGPGTEHTLQIPWIGVIWKHWRGPHYSLKSAEMKIRINSFN